MGRCHPPEADPDFRARQDCAAALGLSPAKLYGLASAVTTRPAPTAGSDSGSDAEQAGTEVPSPSVDLPTSVGAYVLLAAHLATTPSSPPSPSPLPTSATALRHLLPLLHLGLASPSSPSPAPISTDTTLFWSWHLLSSATATNAPPSDGQPAALVQLLTPLAALSPDPRTRLSAFRLVARVVLDLAGSGGERLMLLGALVGVDCPFEGMRVAGVGLVRELLFREFGREGGGEGVVLRGLVGELGGVLFGVEPEGMVGSASGDVVMEEWLAEHHRGTLEKLGLYYFLLARDTGNRVRVPP